MPGKRNTLLHRKLHGKINAAFFFNPWARNPARDSSSKENALLHHPMHQSVWVFCVLLISFFSEPETNIVESSLFMLFYWKTKMPGKNTHCSASFKKYVV